MLLTVHKTLHTFFSSVSSSSLLSLHEHYWNSFWYLNIPCSHLMLPMLPLTFPLSLASRHLLVILNSVKVSLLLGACYDFQNKSGNFLYTHNSLISLLILYYICDYVIIWMKIGFSFPCYNVSLFHESKYVYILFTSVSIGYRRIPEK